MSDAPEDPTAEAQRSAAIELLEKAHALSKLGRFEEVDAVVADLRARFEASADPECRRLVCRALFGMIGDRVARYGKRSLSDDQTSYEEIHRIAAREPMIEDIAAEALFHIGKCAAYQMPGSPLVTRAALAYRDLGKDHAASRDLNVARFVAAGMTNYAKTVWPESEAARSIYEIVISAYARAEAPELRRHAALAMQTWTLGLMRRKHDVEALAILDWSMTLFGESTEPAIEEILAADFVNRALIIGRLHGVDAELAIYDSLEKRFGSSLSEDTLRSVALAKNNHAFTLLDLKRDDEARALFEEVIRRFEHSKHREVATEVERARINLARAQGSST